MSNHLPRDETLEKEDRIDEMKKKQKNNNNKTNKKNQKTTTTTKKKQPTRPAPAASTAGPCPTICQSSRTPRHWKLPSTIARPNHPFKIVIFENYICTCSSSLPSFPSIFDLRSLITMKYMPSFSCSSKLLRSLYNKSIYYSVFLLFQECKYQNETERYAYLYHVIIKHLNEESNK